MTNASISRLQIASILVMAAGQGWSAGNFTPSDAPVWNPLLHLIPVLLVLVLGLPILHGRGAGWASVAMSIFAVLSTIGVIVLIVLGATNSSPNAVGVKSIEDWFPTIFMLLGNILWLATLIPARRAAVEARAASTSSKG
jgi:hypothetical protein